MCLCGTRVDSEESEIVLATRGKKGLIVAASAAVVLVALVAGGLVWHEQPGFCAAICHTPMDMYVDGYNGGDTALLVTVHKTEAQLECLDCHESNLSQQVTEGMSWVSGNYSYPLEQRKLATRDACLGECHDAEEIINATADWGGEDGVNPHDSHEGDQACGLCHAVHRTSTFYCNSCHNWEQPEGWVEPEAEL